MQKFIAEESFWELFPRGGDRGGCRNRHEAHRGSAFRGQRGHRKAARARPTRRPIAISTSNTISQNEAVRVWREAYQRFKTKKGARCSIENLLKRVLKGNPVGSITPVGGHLQRRLAQIRAARGRRGHRLVRRRPALGHHRGRRRLLRARRGRERSHAGRRAVLSRRCGSRVPLLELARWPSHRPVRRFKERVSGDRMRRSNAPRRSGRGASRACPSLSSASSAPPSKRARHRRPARTLIWSSSPDQTSRTPRRQRRASNCPPFPLGNAQTLCRQDGPL